MLRRIEILLASKSQSLYLLFSTALCCCPQVLGEDLKLVLGQQDRMERGSDTWANPVSYDKLGE
jgi:hypothetical protein